MYYDSSRRRGSRATGCNAREDGNSCQLRQLNEDQGQASVYVSRTYAAQSAASAIYVNNS